MAIETENNGSIWRLEEHVEELLPGIPNDITLNEITSKLPWTAFYALSSVNRCWRGAIHRHEVYNARVRAQATETLVMHSHHHGECDAVGLYSLRDDCCYELPAIAHLGKKVLGRFEYTSVNGKIYVVGGLRSIFDGAIGRQDGPDVYMFDVAGQRQWEKCASMQERRYFFSCGVIHGKIYVTGGDDGHKPLLEPEVYDPEVDAWCPIAPMTLGRLSHQVTTFGDELFAYGGYTSPTCRLGLSPPLSYEVYNAAKNEWRLVELAARENRRGFHFMANGRLCSISGKYIDVFDAEKMLWTNLHTNCYAATGFDRVDPVATLAVNDELFACAAVFNSPRKEGFVRTKGIFGENKKLVWQKSNVSCCVQKLSQRRQPQLKGLIHL